MGIEIVALGGDSKWLLIDSHGNLHQTNIPSSLTEQLYGREEDVKFLTLGPNDSWFALYDDGDNAWSDNLPFTSDEALESSRKGDIKCVALGLHDSIIVIYENGIYHDGIPSTLKSRISERSKMGIYVKFVSLGWNEGDYFVRFSDRSTSCRAAGEALGVYNRVGDVDRIIFGPYGRYFIEERDGGLHYHVTHSFESVAAKACSATELYTCEVRYLHDSIDYTFSDGGTIYSLAKKLVNGEVSVEDIGQIQVVAEEASDGTRYWTLDHRRLWVFKAAGIEKIPVQIVDPPHSFRSKRDDALKRYGEGFQVIVRT